MIKITQEEQLGRQLFSGKYQGLIGFMVLFNPFPLKFIVLAAFSAQVVVIQAGGPVVRTVVSVALEDHVHFLLQLEEVPLNCT